MQYKVSILVPVYGVEKYIERCARSLFEQTYENIEYIFVNDCSPDDSIAILQRVAAEYPNRLDSVKIISHNTNKGLGEARNTAVASATGEFVMHVDSDDYVDSRIVELCVDEQTKNDFDIVTCGIRLIREDWQEDFGVYDITNPIEISKGILRHELPANLSARMIRASLYHENNIKVNGGVNNSEDMQVTPQLFYYARSVTYINCHLYFYDFRNTASYSNSFSTKNAMQTWKTIELLGDFAEQYNLRRDYQIGNLFVIAGGMLKSVRLNTAQSREYYNFLQGKLKSYGLRYSCEIPLIKRFVLYLYFYPLVYCYAKLLMIGKNIFRES